jgi:hypothetical protein
LAGELYISKPGGSLTLYVIIRRLSDYKVWSVAASDWATWADGDIDNYDTALTDRGGDFYNGDFPTGIAIGTRVLVMYYQQSGGTPAITDSLLLSVDATWNGAEVASASSVTLDSRALTTLASVKRAMGIASSTTTYDTILTELINQVSDRIERETGRRFAAANYNEWIAAEQEEWFTVRNWPIIRVDRMRYCLDQTITASYSGSDVEAYASVYYDDDGGSGTAKLVSISAAGTETSNTFAFSTYPTLSTLVTAMDAISGWTVSRISSRDGQSLILMPASGLDALNQVAELYAATEFDTVGRVDHRRGMVYCPGYTGLKLVSYRGGYETIPDDVARVANEMVIAAYHMGLSDLSKASESIPDYSYSRGSLVEITDSQRAVLDSYRAFAVGGV